MRSTGTLLPCQAALHVLGMGYWLKVIGVDAVTIAAGVIEFQANPDIPAKVLIHDLVS